MSATAQQISQGHLTSLMITHKLEDAINYGNRLIILNQGIIRKEFNQAEKQRLTVSQLEEYLI